MILPYGPRRTQGHPRIPMVCGHPTKIDWKHGWIDHTQLSIVLQAPNAWKAVIDWKYGWIDHTQLPIILQAPNAQKAVFGLQTRNHPRPIHTKWYFIRRVTIGETTTLNSPIPQEYQRHSKIFSKAESQRLPAHSIWDHAIELLPNTPSTLPRWLLSLTQEEIHKCHKFIQEHIQRGTITRLKSPYAANFFIKKKDGKLRPVQDYWPLNKWTIQNQNVSPLIAQAINWLSRCTLFTKFNVWWGYNNIHIKEDNRVFQSCHYWLHYLLH